ncbi:MAG: fasciclin domain-containing protein, partial [Methanofollis liminatans]|nr:fasciclin domain-containing protein [Methanofollis liminatans]
GDGPFTVFAPTDATFEALPAGALDGLLANTTELSRVLTYHVVSGKYMSTEIAGMSSLTSLEGSDLAITTDGGVKVDGANVTTADIECSNGVIHVIDAVMLPP